MLYLELFKYFKKINVAGGGPDAQMAPPPGASVDRISIMDPPALATLVNREETITSIANATQCRSLIIISLNGSHLWLLFCQE